MITFKSTGSFKGAFNFMKSLSDQWYLKRLDEYGQKGVKALEDATPKRTGKTAASWSYEIEEGPAGFRIVWKNSNMTKYNISVAILIQMGHGTRHGAYIQGIDYINPALRPVFEEMTQKIWKEVEEK